MYKTMFVCERINDSKKEFKEIKVDRLIKDLQKGKSYYEVLNSNEQKFIKPYFEVDDNEKEIDLSSLYNNSILFLNRIFDSKNEDWAISEDNRDSKNSYHLILTNKKTKIQDLLKLRDNVSLSDYHFDTSVYSNGFQKFRMILSKKDTDKTSLGLKPITYEDDLKKHFIQYVEDEMLEWRYTNEEISIGKKKKKEIKDIKFCDEQKEFLKQFKIISKNGNNIDIKYDCPWNDNHKSNNRYLTIHQNVIILKCHSIKCKDKTKVIWERPCQISTDESDEEDLYEISSTDDNLAKLFKKFYGDKFVYVYDIDQIGHKKMNGNFYYYNGKYWKLDRDCKKISLMIPNDLYEKLDKEINERMTKSNYDKMYFINLKDSLKYLQSESKIQNVIKRLEKYLEKEIRFNTNPYVMVFKNGVYDLKKFEFRKSKKEEYISDFRSTGYNYEKVSDKDKAFLTEYLHKTFLNESERKIYLTYLATTLLGKSIKNFCINNGAGNNNKTRLMEFTHKMVGSYGMKINISVFIERTPDRATLNKLHLIRFYYAEEPPEGSVLNGTLLKDLSGSSKLSFRALYKSDTEIDNHSTGFINCNKKPDIQPVDPAIRDRLIDKLFEAKFTNDDVDNITRFQADKYFEKEEFYDKYKLTLFHILLDYLKIFYEQKEQIILNESLIKRRDQYLLDCDDFYCWFNDRFEKTKNKQDFIQLQDIWDIFKRSEYFDNLPKKSKRKMTKKKFKEDLLSRNDINKYWRDRIQSNGKDKLSCIVCFKFREEDICEIDDDE